MLHALTVAAATSHAVWAERVLPPVFFGWQLWQIQLWQWIGILVGLGLALAFGYLAGCGVGRLLARVASLTRWEWDNQVAASMRGPLVGGGLVLGFIIVLPGLALPDAPQRILLGGCKLVALLSLGWFLLRIVDVTAAILSDVFKARGQEMGVAMVPVTRRILKPILVAVAAVVVLQNMGMDVGGLLATLGIGGLAVALAAKDTLANLFGSLAIAFDRPFKVGDFVKAGDFVGTVEDLGLRSTKIRTLSRTVVTIPNSQLADSKVENYTRRDRMRIETTFSLQLDTSAEQVRYIIDEMKRCFLGHGRIDSEDFSARFTGYSSSSADIAVHCYVLTSNFAEYTGVREEIYFALGEIIERSGACLAYPSRTVYVGKDSAADAKKAKHAAAAVAERRAAGTLCLPEIPEAVRAEYRQRREADAGPTI